MSIKPIIGMRHADPIGFEGRSHVHNFIRYLFSQTRKHPETSDTCRNMVIEYEGRRRPATKRTFYNHAAASNCDAFLAGHADSPAPQADWCNDLTYFAFLIPLKGLWVSNFVSGRDGSRRTPLRMHCEQAASCCLQYAFDGDQEAMMAEISRTLGPDDLVVEYQRATDEVQAAVNKALLMRMNARHPGKPALAIFHNDQESTCHIHRILWRQ
jgi:hypothetical protein